MKARRSLITRLSTRPLSTPPVLTATTPGTKLNVIDLKAVKNSKTKPYPLTGISPQSTTFYVTNLDMYTYNELEVNVPVPTITGSVINIIYRDVMSDNYIPDNYRSKVNPNTLKISIANGGTLIDPGKLDYIILRDQSGVSLVSSVSKTEKGYYITGLTGPFFIHSKLIK